VWFTNHHHLKPCRSPAGYDLPGDPGRPSGVYLRLNAPQGSPGGYDRTGDPAVSLPAFVFKSSRFPNEGWSPLVVDCPVDWIMPGERLKVLSVNVEISGPKDATESLTSLQIDILEHILTSSLVSPASSTTGGFLAVTVSPLTHSLGPLRARTACPSPSRPCPSPLTMPRPLLDVQNASSAHKTTISPRESFASTDSVAWRTAIPLRDLEDQTCGDHEGQIRPPYAKEDLWTAQIRDQQTCSVAPTPTLIRPLSVSPDHVPRSFSRRAAPVTTLAPTRAILQGVNGDTQSASSSHQTSWTGTPIFCDDVCVFVSRWRGHRSDLGDEICLEHGMLCVDCCQRCRSYHPSLVQLHTTE